MYTQVYPPDTDTPGYEQENKTKPPECAEISEGGGLYSAEDVARVVIRGVEKKSFHITVDFLAGLFVRYALTSLFLTIVDTFPALRVDYHRESALLLI